MRRLLVHVEGETEETFVGEVLAPHLLRFGYAGVSARLVGNARQRDRRGGIRGWNSVRFDILRHLKEDPQCRATTMVDFYALPRSGAGAWPGRNIEAGLPIAAKASSVESGIRDDIGRDMGDGFDARRFVPYVMMHEFEGLLFSDCGKFAQAVGDPSLREPLQQIRDDFDSPEEINDSPETAPSKRIESLLPHYQKPLFGVIAVLEIGLERIREDCALFDRWLQVLES